MKTTRSYLSALMRSLCMLVLAVAASAQAQDASGPRGPEQVFSSPDDAVNALVAANRTNDQAALLKIFGPNGSDLISSGDPVADQAGRTRFLTAYDAAHDLKDEDDKKRLFVGTEEWPMPIPIVRADDGWQWDTEAGRQEILNRRIGRNELNVIEVCREYVEAQREFAAQRPPFRGRLEYAQKFVSTPGKRDGLYWPVSSSQPESPFGPFIAQAHYEGYKSAPLPREPFHGYYYKILTGQGPYASGGAKSYIAQGHMTGGFALLAFPAKYGDSGVMSFIVNQHGIVYEKNLGPDTEAIASTITTYNPDSSWRPVRDISPDMQRNE